MEKSSGLPEVTTKIKIFITQPKKTHTHRGDLEGWIRRDLFWVTLMDDVILSPSANRSLKAQDRSWVSCWSKKYLYFHTKKAKQTGLREVIVLHGGCGRNNKSFLEDLGCDNVSSRRLLLLSKHPLVSSTCFSASPPPHFPLLLVAFSPGKNPLFLPCSGRRNRYPLPLVCMYEREGESSWGMIARVGLHSGRG